MPNTTQFSSWIVIAGVLGGPGGCDLTAELFVDRPLCEQLCARVAECADPEASLDGELEAEPSPEESGEERAEDGSEESEPLDPCVEECVDHVEFIDAGLPDATMECVEAIRDVRECLIGLASCGEFDENMTLTQAQEDVPLSSLQGLECWSKVNEEVAQCGCESDAKWCEGQ